MSPHLQPSSLFKLSIKSTLSLINKSLYVIECSFAEVEYEECKKKINAIKKFLMATLPSRLFDVLCLERRCCVYPGDPRILLNVLLHPKLSVFRKCNLDHGISQRFWIKVVPCLTRLIVLDLKFLCTDEILQIISSKCPLIEELNIVSRVDVCKSRINASVMIRNVSDVGLSYITKLKHLRILSMDPPRNQKSSRVGRCVTQSGIIMLLRDIPYLEELNIESCDIGSTIIRSNVSIGPLSLRKVNCHLVSAKGIRKLIKTCPHIKELTVTHLTSKEDRNKLLEEITKSDLRLNKLNISFFSYTETLLHLLQVQGRYLTHFTLWDVDQSVNIDSIVSIGTCCPNLNSLVLMTQSNHLFVPRFFKRPEKIFTELHSLTLGNENFNLGDILLFFLQYADKLQRLTLKYQSKVNFDEILLSIIQKGYLKDICYMWLDCTLEVNRRVVMKVIQSFDKLSDITVDFTEDAVEIIYYIHDNNLDLKIGGY